LAAADVAFVGGHPAYVVRELLDQVSVEVVELLAHFVSVVLIDAEHDGLGEAGSLARKTAEARL
jgi:hypothetical protein